MKQSLRDDVLRQLRGIHMLNAGSAIGYLFTPTESGNSIAVGMFCHFEDEKDPDQWEYFYDLIKKPHERKIFKVK